MSQARDVVGGSIRLKVGDERLREGGRADGRLDGGDVDDSACRPAAGGRNDDDVGHRHPNSEQPNHLTRGDVMVAGDLNVALRQSEVTRRGVREDELHVGIEVGCSYTSQGLIRIISNAS